MPAGLRTLLSFPKRAEAVGIKMMLDEIGFSSSEICTSGVETWGMLNLHKFDLVITDRDLTGGMDGMELIKRINADRTLFFIPVILITSENRKNKIMEAICAGVSGYILRPYKLATIEEKIREIVNGRGAFSRKMSRVDQGKNLLTQGKLDEAIVVFKELVAEDPKDEELYQLGYQCMAEGRFNEAITAFRKAIEINHLYAEAYRGLGEAYMKKGDITEAEKFLIMAGQLFIQRAQFDEAREAILMALQVNPNSINPYNTLGIVYRKTGDFKKSIQYYDLALQINSQDEKIFYNLAHALVEDRQEGRAMDVLQKALVLKPDFEEARAFHERLSTGRSLPLSSMPRVFKGRYVPIEEVKGEFKSVIHASDTAANREVLIIRYEVPKEVEHSINWSKVEEAWSGLTRIGGLSHPYSKVLYDVSRDENVFYLIEEWVVGQSVAELFESGRTLPMRMALEVAVGVAEVLAYMHRQNVIHQSLTPADIVLTKERSVKVSGFCRYTFEELLRTGINASSPPLQPYYSPEHFSGKPITPASDVFSLGTILYETIMRENPFAAETASGLVFNVCFKEPAPFKHHIIRIEQAVQDVFNRSMAKDPAKRPANGDEMAGLLIDVMDFIDRSWRQTPQFLKRI